MTRTVPPMRVLALPDLQKVQAVVPNSLTSRKFYFPEVRLAFTDRAGAPPPRICFGALAPACEWAPWIVLRCRLVGIGSYVRGWLSLFVCQVSVAASLVLHGGLVRPCHGGGFRRSRIIVMVGIHILLRECSLGSEGDRRDRENQKHSSNRFHTAPLKGIECLIVKSGDGCFRSSAANAGRRVAVATGSLPRVTAGSGPVTMPKETSALMILPEQEQPLGSVQFNEVEYARPPSHGRTLKFSSKRQQARWPLPPHWATQLTGTPRETAKRKKGNNG